MAAGEAEVFIAGAWRSAREGDVIYIPGDEVHGARNRGDTTCRICMLPVDDHDDVEYVDDQDRG